MDIVEALSNYSARSLFSQFHLFFNGAVTVSESCLRSLAYHELASAALQDQQSKHSSSPSEMSSESEGTLCEEPLTRSHLATFSYTRYKALVSSDTFFVVSKHFAYPRNNEDIEYFMDSEPWFSVASTCVGCHSTVEKNTWIQHRDSCTGIEDRMLQSVFVQSETLAALQMVWDTALQLSVSVPCGANLASEDESIHPEKLTKSKERVIAWLRTIEDN